MEKVWYDVRHATARLRRDAKFTLTTVLTLSLGVGATVLVFSVANVVFLRNLSYPNANRLVWAREFFPNLNRSMVLTPDYVAWKQQSVAFDRLEAMGPTFGTNLRNANRPAERVQTAHVTPGFFAMMGVSQRLGPGFDPNAIASDQHVAILSDTLWRSYFQADSGVVGNNVNLNGKPFTIVGVMPRGFVYVDGPDVAVWLPDAVTPAAMVPGRSTESMRVIGRLKPGISLGRSRDELARIARRMDDQYPAPWAEHHAAAEVRVVSLQKQLTADSRLSTTVLMGAVGFLLLIACANVANLFLAHSVRRRKEFAIRIAIGAARGKVVRMLLLESLLLGTMGGALGLVLLFWGRRAVTFLMPRVLPQDIPIDWRVLMFAAGCSVISGLLFGVAPAIVASRISVNSGLKATDSGSGGFLPVLLTAGQIALSLMLLTGAGLMMRSLLVLTSTKPGYDSRNVLTATVMLREYGPEQQTEFSDRMLTGIETLRGIQYAAVTSSPPMTPFSELETGLRADNGPKMDDIVSVSSVSPKYFQAVGMRLVAGRFFDARDGRLSPRVAILNQTLAKVLFGGRNPLGHEINGSATVVGVAADIRHRALDDKLWPELFLPFQQSPSPWMTVVVRGYNNPSSLAVPIRRMAQSIDPSQPLFDVDLLEHRISQSLSERRARTTALGGFAVLALLIAVVGTYGVLSFSVALRTREIGIRIALGAGHGDVLRMVIGAGLRIAAIGITVGLGGALFVTRLLRTLLYGIEPTDHTTFSVVCGILIAAGLMASYLPARRAAMVDPNVALREE